MVEADRAGVPHGGGERAPEQRMALRAHAVRARGRKAPVLPARIERVGRRAEARAPREELGVRRDLRAAAVHRYGEVEVQPDRHAERPGARRRMRDLRIREPLQPGVVGRIARARGMSEIAKKTGLRREGLYKMLSVQGNPELATVLRILQAIGVQLVAEPVKVRRKTGGKASTTRKAA